MRKSIYLNDSENLTLELLAKGKSPKVVREEIGFEKPMIYFYSFLGVLRNKTGIADLKCPAEIRDFQRKSAALSPHLVLSDRQYKLAYCLLDAIPLKYAAQKLETDEASAEREMRDLLQTCAIFSKHTVIQRSQMRLFLATHPSRNRKELSETSWKLLRLMAAGEDPKLHPEFSRASEEGLQSMMKDVTSQLGLGVPGRNARRNLVQLFVAAWDLRNEPERQTEATREHWDLFFRLRLGMNMEALMADLDLPEEEAIAKGLKMCQRIGFKFTERDILGADWKDPLSFVIPGENTLTDEECNLLWYYACRYMTLHQAVRNAGYFEEETFLSHVTQILERIGMKLDKRQNLMPKIAAMLKRVNWPERAEGKTAKPYQPKEEVTMNDPFF